MPNRSRGESVSFGSSRPRGVNPNAALPAEFKLTWPLQCVRPVIPKNLMPEKVNHPWLTAKPFLGLIGWNV